MWCVVAYAIYICLSQPDASAALQVRALKDYCNNYDLTSLNIKAGDVITVIFIRPALKQIMNIWSYFEVDLFYSHALLKFKLC